MILLNFVNDYKSEKEATKDVNNDIIYLYSNMHNIGDHGEYIRDITLKVNGANDEVYLQMTICNLGTTTTFALARCTADKSSMITINDINTFISESFMKLKKYRTRLLETIDRAIHSVNNSGIYRTYIITIRDPDLDADEYNINLTHAVDYEGREDD